MKRTTGTPLHRALASGGLWLAFAAGLPVASMAEVLWSASIGYDSVVDISEEHALILGSDRARRIDLETGAVSVLLEVGQGEATLEHGVLLGGGGVVIARNGGVELLREDGQIRRRLTPQRAGGNLAAVGDGMALFSNRKDKTIHYVQADGSVRRIGTLTSGGVSEGSVFALEATPRGQALLTQRVERSARSPTRIFSMRQGRPELLGELPSSGSVFTVLDVDAPRGRALAYTVEHGREFCFQRLAGGRVTRLHCQDLASANVVVTHDQTGGTLTPEGNAVLSYRVDGEENRYIILKVEEGGVSRLFESEELPLKHVRTGTDSTIYFAGLRYGDWRLHSLPPGGSLERHDLKITSFLQVRDGVVLTSHRSRIRAFRP